MPNQLSVGAAMSSRKQNRLAKQRNSKKLLEGFLALDREIVEISMRTYKVPPREMLMLREQNRRLHTALRDTRLKSRLLRLPY